MRPHGTTYRDVSRLRACLAALACVLSGLCTAPAPSRAAVQLPAGFENQQLANLGFPTGMAFTPDGRLLLLMQTGQVRVYENGVFRTTRASTSASKLCTDIERGLTGIAVDPGFADNHYIYLYYTYDKGNDSCGTNQADPELQPVNRLSRFVLGSNSLIDPASETVMLDNIPSVSGNHNAGDIHFGKDGYLYLTIGDSGCDYTGASACGMWNNSATYRNALVGKIVRITADGDIPIDNPHQGPGTSRCNVTGRTIPGDWCQEIFATGLRNPFRFAFDDDAPTTRFFINDVGNDHWEEINLGAPGADYGWNLREGHCAVASYTDCGPPPAGMTNPVYDYDHTGGCTSITAGAFVPDGVWPSQYDTSYLYGDFVCGKLFQLFPDGGGGFTSAEFASEVGALSRWPLALRTRPPKRCTTSLGQARPALFRIRYTGSANRSPVAVAPPARRTATFRSPRSSTAPRAAIRTTSRSASTGTSATDPPTRTPPAPRTSTRRRARTRRR